MKLVQLTMAASATLLLVSACSNQDVANNQAATINEASDANMMIGDPANQISDLEPLVDEVPAVVTPVAAPATQPKATPAPKAATPKAVSAPAPKAPTPPPADPHAGHDMNNM